MSIKEAHASEAISAVNLKLPPFSPTNLHLWFAQVEVQFSTRGITAQKTKYEYVVTSLSAEYATQVRDLILHVPAASPYDTLKRQLTARTALPAERWLRQLFQSKELGDQRPSQLLRCMQQLLGEDTAGADGTLLLEMFLQRLPTKSAWSWPHQQKERLLKNLLTSPIELLLLHHSLWPVSRTPNQQGR